MNVKEWLDKVAYIENDLNEYIVEEIQIYKSKFDNSYITQVGMESVVQFLADREITEQLTNGVGFSLKDNRWYGWSHRAIYSFGIGSNCKKGDAHYNGSTIKEQEEDAIRFWMDDDHINLRCEGIIEENGDRYFDIKWEYSNKIPNKKLRNTTSGSHHHIKPLGKGEWVAKTMEDAKQMAIDFNEGVS